MTARGLPGELITRSNLSVTPLAVAFWLTSTTWTAWNRLSCRSCPGRSPPPSARPPTTPPQKPPSPQPRSSLVNRASVFLPCPSSCVHYHLESSSLISPPAAV